MTESGAPGANHGARPRRWTVEQVAAVAPTPRSVAAAEPAADPARWSALGADDRALWGRCRGSGAEPYETFVDHVEAAWRCSCPSRRPPCKHAVALLLMWVRDMVPDGQRPSPVTAWVAARDARAARAAEPSRRAGERGADGETAADTPGNRGEPAGGAPTGDDRDEPPDRDAPDRDALDHGRDERVARMRDGLVELDRWLEDRIRIGLSDPALTRYSTWDALAARLVDARAGALANRVRRVAGLVGAGPNWHSDVLAELGLLHLIAQAGQRLPHLPGNLADTVAAAAGWQVRQADVLAGVGETDEWVVLGRSDTREDRIEVRRVWLRGRRSGAWGMLLSFAAYQQVLDDGWQVGTTVHADLHRYPGGSLRCLPGRRHADPVASGPILGLSIPAACDEVGTRCAAEPWLERMATTVVAATTYGDGHWVLTDETGSLVLHASATVLATVLAASAGRPLTMTVEWTPSGLVPLTLHLDDRSIDVGPRADPSFVGAV